MVSPFNLSSSVSGISFSGLATGLDSAAIINALVSLETRAVKTPLVNAKSEAQEKLTLFDSLKSKLSTLRDKVRALDTTGELNVFKASSSDSTILTATATGSALAGSHTITVTTLATNEVEKSTATFTDQDTETVGTGTLDIVYAGTTTSLTIDSSNNTLATLATEINDAGIGVKATVVNTAAEGGTDAFVLVLTGEDTGLANSITVDATGLTGGDQTLAFSNAVAAANAKVTVDGIVDIERSSNTINDIIPGVTLELLSSAPSSPVTLSVSQDVSKIKSKITEFVNAYNAVVDFINTQQEFVEDEPTEPLFGDFTLRVIKGELTSDILGVQISSNTFFESLAVVGINFDNNGKLEIDDDTLTDKIEDDIDKFAKLFIDNSSGTDGIAKTLRTTLDDMLSEADGIIKIAKDTLNDKIRDLDDEIEDADDRLEALTTRLTKQYSDLEVTVAALNSQLSFLSSIGVIGSK